MGGGDSQAIRSLPRCFVAGLPDPLVSAFDLPAEESDKFRRVLRLSTGDEIAVLPGDGRLVRCRLEGKGAVPLQTLCPATGPEIDVTLALALSKPEALELSVRMATELGANGFVLFPSDRSVVRWEPSKWVAKQERLEKIAREAAEVSFRTKLPQFSNAPSLAQLLHGHVNAIVLDEGEAVTEPLWARQENPIMLVVGPEGGWSPKERQLIAGRGVTLGPRVLRVSTAVAAACAVVLCDTRK